MLDRTNKILHFLLLSQKAKVYREIGYARRDGHRVERAAWLEVSALRKAEALWVKERVDAAGSIH